MIPGGAPSIAEYVLPRMCPACGGDTLLGPDSCSWSDPDVVPRREIGYVGDVATWRPPPA
jgi:hypothetical protein